MYMPRSWNDIMNMLNEKNQKVEIKQQQKNLTYSMNESHVIHLIPACALFYSSATPHTRTHRFFFLYVFCCAL